MAITKNIAIKNKNIAIKKQDLKQCYDEASEIKLSEFSGAKSPLRTVIFQPDYKSTEAKRFRGFVKNTLPVPLHDCHMFSWHINDNRHGLLGRGDHKDVCTRIDCKAHRLPGRQSTQALTTHCKLRPLAAEEEPEKDRAIQQNA